MKHTGKSECSSFYLENSIIYKCLEELTSSKKFRKDQIKSLKEMTLVRAAINPDALQIQ